MWFAVSRDRLARGDEPGRPAPVTKRFFLLTSVTLEAGVCGAGNWFSSRAHKRSAARGNYHSDSVRVISVCSRVALIFTQVETHQPGLRSNLHIFWIRFKIFNSGWILTNVITDLTDYKDQNANTRRFWTERKMTRSHSEDSIDLNKHGGRVGIA